MFNSKINNHKKLTINYVYNKLKKIKKEIVLKKKMIWVWVNNNKNQYKKNNKKLLKNNKL